MTVSGHIVFDERGRRREQGHPIFSTEAAATLVDVPAVLPNSVALATKWEHDALGRVTKLTTPSDPEDIAVILDLFWRPVVGWAASAINDRALALALAARRPAPGLVHHSDRGSPYARDDYRAVLGAHGLIPSMSRAGDCRDNAVAESFFATLKAELVEYERYPTRAAAIASIGDYSHNLYNRKRRHSRLPYMSPIEYELKSYLTALAVSETVRGIGGGPIYEY